MTDSTETTKVVLEHDEAPPPAGVPLNEGERQAFAERLVAEAQSRGCA